MADQQTTRDALQRQIAGLQRQIADLQRQDSSIQGEIAQHRQELTQSSQDLAQRSQDLAQSTEALTQQTRDLAAVRAETDKLRQGIDRLREQRQAEEASLARQKAQEQLAAITPPRPVPPKPTPRTPQPLPVRQPTQSTPGPQPGQSTPAGQPGQPTNPQPAQLMPATSSAQQLQTARQWLSAGRPDEARRILAMVQTQMVFQPVTPDQPQPRGAVPPRPTSAMLSAGSTWVPAARPCSRSRGRSAMRTRRGSEPAGEPEPRRKHATRRWTRPRLVWLCSRHALGGCPAAAGLLQKRI